jgi:hypothetical protein
MAGGVFGFVGASPGAGRARDPGLRDDNYRGNRCLLVRVVCWCVNVRGAARLGAITATIIVLLLPAQGPLWGVPLLRLVQVVLGTVSTLLVSWLFTQVQQRLARR